MNFETFQKRIINGDVNNFNVVGVRVTINVINNQMTVKNLFKFKVKTRENIPVSKMKESCNNTIGKQECVCGPPPRNIIFDRLRSCHYPMLVLYGVIFQPIQDIYYFNVLLCIPYE